MMCSIVPYLYIFFRISLALFNYIVSQVVTYEEWQMQEISEKCCISSQRLILRRSPKTAEHNCCAIVMLQHSAQLADVSGLSVSVKNF